MKKKHKILLTVCLLLFIFGVVPGCVAYYLFFSPQYRSAEKSYVYIDRDDNIDSVYVKLKTQGAARQVAGFKLLASLKKYPEHIHTGRFAVQAGDNNWQVFKRISHGEQEPLKLQINSVRTIDRLARQVGQQLMLDSVDIMNCLTDTTFLHKLGYTPETIPCLFVPNTYEMYWNIGIDNFFKRMQKEHDNFWSGKRQQQASRIGFTPEEVCTLASIVEEETNNNAEKPAVAGLYINRLHKGMLLQADPTVKFAAQNFGLRRVLNKHLETDSPYNTYIHKGLPPGPIRIPSIVGIDAVLNYAHHNYLYMCAKEDFSGTHNFASTYAQHKQNAMRYWKALNERNIK